MKQHDFHGWPVDEAVKRAIEIYNRHIESGQRDKLIFIHGYGSSGKGYSIGEQIRVVLKRSGVDFIPGELAGGNAGRTIVFPGPTIQYTRPPRALPPVGVKPKVLSRADRRRERRRHESTPVRVKPRVPPLLVLAKPGILEITPVSVKATVPSLPRKDSAPASVLRPAAQPPKPPCLSVRIYALAREHDIPSKDVVDTCLHLGLDVMSHMSAISEEDAKRVLQTMSSRSPGRGVADSATATVPTAWHPTRLAASGR